MALVLILASALLSAPAIQEREPAWVWNLYESDGLTLAREVPDTARLDATFECDPGSSVAVLTLYDAQGPSSGFARVSAGESSATAEIQTAPRGSRRLTLRTDHPVFAAFAADGALGVIAGEMDRRVSAPAGDVAKLRRFVELCTG